MCPLCFAPIPSAVRILQDILTLLELFDLRTLYQIAGNAADTLDWLICRFFTMAVWALVSNNAGIAADWVAVNRMIDRP